MINQTRKFTYLTLQVKMMSDELENLIKQAINEQLDGKYFFVDYHGGVINEEVKTNLAILELKYN